MRSSHSQRPKLPQHALVQLRPVFFLLLGVLGTCLVVYWNLKREEELQLRHILQRDFQRLLSEDTRFSQVHVGFDAPTDASTIEGQVPKREDLAYLNTKVARVHPPKGSTWRILVRVKQSPLR